MKGMLEANNQTVPTSASKVSLYLSVVEKTKTSVCDKILCNIRENIALSRAHNMKC